MDFLIETTGKPLDIFGLVVFIIVTIIALAMFIVMIVFLVKKDIKNFFPAVVLFCIAIGLSGFIGYMIFIVDKEKVTISYDTDKFKAWVLDEYLIEINDEQATALLENTANEKEPYINSAVYVKTFNVEDAIATLFNEGKEWRLVVTQSIAVSSK